MADGREVWITGVGLLTCLGEGLDANWQGLHQPPAADASAFAPYVVHRAAAVDFDQQIPKKSDQRQMDTWQRIGVYAAGMALDAAGVKGNAELLSRMDMIVAAGGGERDANVDISILDGLRRAADREAYLNQRLLNDLRPTLFLAQLANLMAGNISIVHGVTGSSRTLMGEEGAGADSVRISHARIAAGQGDLALVGGACNAERWELLLAYALGKKLSHGERNNVWERAAGGGGLELGSLAAFLVLEEKQHALGRGAKPVARLASVDSDHVQRTPGAITAGLERMWTGIAARITPENAAVLSGATGVAAPTAEERAFIGKHPGLAVRATGTHLGHAPEAQFAANIALAATAVQRDELYPPCDSSGVERPMSAPLKQAVVTGVGHWRGECLALVEAVG